MTILVNSILIGTIAGWIAGIIIKREYLRLHNSILGIISFWLSVSLRFIDISYFSFISCILVTIPVTCAVIWLADKLKKRYQKK